jgi:uncharacterized phage protein gp47/JayE
MRDREKDVARRTMLAGAGTAGALTAAAALLPARAPTVAGVADADKPAAEPAAGYRLTEHVKQYYRTTRV